jgi:hypothetical protein
LTTADMVKVGREVMDTKGLCFTCHTIGKERRASVSRPRWRRGLARQTRVAGLSDVEYFAQTLVRTGEIHRAGIQSGHAGD